jgi:type VI secretion system protein VasG
MARLSVIPYYSLTTAHLTQITHLKLDEIRERLLQQHQAILHTTSDDVSAILNRLSHQMQGARSIDRVLTTDVLPQLSNFILKKQQAGELLREISFQDLDNLWSVHSS